VLAGVLLLDESPLEDELDEVSEEELLDPPESGVDELLEDDEDDVDEADLDRLSFL
jgi:hypothetical protein